MPVLYLRGAIWNTMIGWETCTCACCQYRKGVWNRLEGQDSSEDKQKYRITATAAYLAAQTKTTVVMRHFSRLLLVPSLHGSAPSQLISYPVSHSFWHIVGPRSQGPSLLIPRWRPSSGIRFRVFRVWTQDMSRRKDRREKVGPNSWFHSFSSQHQFAILVINSHVVWIHPGWRLGDIHFALRSLVRSVTSTYVYAGTIFWHTICKL